MATYKKKLIEVSLPLPEVNDASAYDKMPGIGPHPKGIHHWWARLPLPTARAVLFASVVDDPSEHPEAFPTEVEQTAERERLFGILRRMMQKKLHEHPEVYAEAGVEMLKHCGGRLPKLLDPFAGGGSIPLEAARLGFEAHGADLNPVAALLNKCNLEIVPKWVTRSPINPDSRAKIGGSDAWPGARGLAEDLRYYGERVRKRIVEKIGRFYPQGQLSREYGNSSTNVVAWIWARTVASEDAAALGRHVPLVSSFMLSTKKGSEAWVEPVIDKSAPDGWRFEVRTGQITKDQIEKARNGTRAGKAQDFVCLLTRTPIRRSYIQQEGKASRLRMRLMALVVEAPRGKAYQSPSIEHERIAESMSADPRLPEARATFLSGAIPNRAGITGGVCSAYGLDTWGHLFTSRQLMALMTLSDEIKQIAHDIRGDAGNAGLSTSEAEQYTHGMLTFLALALDRCADFNNALSRWNASNQKVMNLFGRQALPMVWDFAEANILGESVGGWSTCVEYAADCVRVIPGTGIRTGIARQQDAAAEGAVDVDDVLVSTDPPYYNNIGYAALSDFFYAWLRRTIGGSYPDLFSTVLVPKVAELTAVPDRFEGSKSRAKEHFESGFRRAFTSLREKLDSRFPLTVYYAFKQEDEEGSEPEIDETEAERLDLTTGWETLLEALIGSGFQITATLPVRASQKWRMVSMGTNALASYIVLACRPRAVDAPQSGRREFLAELRKELPVALRHLQQGNVAPVDFAQAAIGPGMAVYSRYSRILESTGKPMSVRAALGLINQVKDEILGEAEADYDPYTRWAIAWYDQHGFEVGEFGDANTLANAHAVAVSALRDAGLVKSREGEVRLLRAEELEKDWEPEDDSRPSIWRMTHQLVRCYFVDKRGDVETAVLLRKLGGAGESSRDLAYRLFAIAERRKRSQDAQGYNALVLGWPEITRLAQSAASTSRQAELL
ncbi:MAG: DUF1156 domain-containing protein [Burkholderiales bacterium]|nr:DUF1156 domain-containing protein [Burkholderiales bacterium]